MTLPASGTPADGSETKITAGSNVTVIGGGTTESPYVISASAGGTGAVQVFASGTNTTLSGAGASTNPFKYNVADATALVKGVVQLAPTNNTTSTELAATPANVAAQVAGRVLKSGDTMTGSLNFSGDSLRLGIQSYVGPDYAKTFRVQNTIANQGTGFLIIPNGTATASNVTTSNTSNLAGPGSYVSTGMNGSTAVINTFGINGGATPDLDVQRNGVSVATFESGGMRIAGGALPIGYPTQLLTGPFNLGGFNANVLSVAALDLEIVSTVGSIRTYLQNKGMGAAEAEGVEEITRPLYAFMSCLLADLKNRKII